MEKELEKLLNSFKNDDIIIDKVEEYLDQNFIGKEVIKKIELMRYTEWMKEMRGTEYANGWSDAVDKLLDLIK